MDINGMELLFKTHVDSSIRKNVKFALKDICERHNIEYSYNLSIIQIKRNLDSKIKKMLNRKGTLDNSLFYKIKSQLLLKHYIYNEPLFPYAEYYFFINARYNSDMTLPDLNNEKEWENLCVTILDYIQITNESAVNLHSHKKEKNEAVAANYWIAKGHTIDVSNGKLDVSEKVYQNICNEVEAMLIKVGGQNVIKYLLNNTRFDEKMLRYRLVRNLSPTQVAFNPAIPFGYLINLSVKHFVEVNHRSTKVFLSRVAELIEMSNHSISLLQLQSYNIYEGIHLNQESFAEHIFNNILYDKIMLYKQYNPIFTTRIIKGMLKNFFTEIDGEKHFQMKFDELTSIINFLLNNPSQDQHFRTYQIEDVAKAFPMVETHSIKRLLDNFSHKKDINRDFNYPNSISDFEQKPLIYRKGKYILIDKTLCANAFYECLCDVFRIKIGKRFDELLGYELEDFIKLLLEKKQVKINYGYYDYNEECDVVIESEERIFFLEIKKKALTRKASAGDGVLLFSDIAKSLLNSQIQLGKHEINLYKNNELVLYRHKGKPKKSSPINAIIKLNGRRIERISINASDYGILNDKQYTQNLLKFLTGVNINTTEESRDIELNEIRKFSEVLYEQFLTFQELEKGKERKSLEDYYFDSSFLSLQMLMTRLEDVVGTEEFVKNFDKTKYVITGIGDPYFEYNQMKDL